MGIMSRLSGLADIAGFGNLSKAFAEDTMSAVRMSTNVINNEMANAGMDLLRRAASHSNDTIENIAKNVDLKKNDEIIKFVNENINDLAKIDDNEAFQTAIKTYKDNMDILSKHNVDLTKSTGDRMNAARELLGRKEKPGLGIKGTVEGFYTDAEFGDTRFKATLAGAAGIAVGGRLVSGGSLTTNSRGERDIAGIPFI